MTSRSVLHEVIVFEFIEEKVAIRENERGCELLERDMEMRIKASLMLDISGFRSFACTSPTLELAVIMSYLASSCRLFVGRKRSNTFTDKAVQMMSYFL